MKNIVIIVACFAVLVVISDGDDRHHRVKRKVLFTKNSKLFARLNGKDNVIPWVQIFAQGWAIRLNFELPETMKQRHVLFKRDIYTTIENVLKMPYGEAYACIMKFLCEMVHKVNKSKSCGVFCTIGKMITRSEDIEALLFKKIFGKCKTFIQSCPATVAIHSGDELNNM